MLYGDQFITRPAEWDGWLFIYFINGTLRNVLTLIKQVDSVHHPPVRGFYFKQKTNCRHLARRC